MDHIRPELSGMYEKLTIEWSEEWILRLACLMTFFLQNPKIGIEITKKKKTSEADYFGKVS